MTFAGVMTPTSTWPRVVLRWIVLWTTSRAELGGVGRTVRYNLVVTE
jgi:hypothetical protein